MPYHTTQAPAAAKAYFEKQAAAPAPPRPASLDAAETAIIRVSVPAKYPSDTPSDVEKTYNKSIAPQVALLFPADATAGVEAEYVKYHALVAKAADEWAAQDALNAKAWSQAKMAGGAAMKEFEGVTIPDYWQSGNPVRPRRKRAHAAALSTVRKTFWALDAAVRTKARGPDAQAAIQWLAAQAAARKRIIDAGKVPFDCAWMPVRGKSTKERTKLWVEYVQESAASVLYPGLPVASCEPSDQQISATCTALGERKS